MESVGVETRTERTFRVGLLVSTEDLTRDSQGDWGVQKYVGRGKSSGETGVPRSTTQEPGMSTGVECGLSGSTVGTVEREEVTVLPNHS